MEKTMVIIDKQSLSGFSAVAIYNIVKKEWVYNSMVYKADIAYLLEDFSLNKVKKETIVKMQSSHPCFIELKNLGYRIETVKL